MCARVFPQRYHIIFQSTCSIIYVIISHLFFRNLLLEAPNYSKAELKQKMRTAFSRDARSYDAHVLNFQNIITSQKTDIVICSKNWFSAFCILQIYWIHMLLLRYLHTCTMRKEMKYWNIKYEYKYICKKTNIHRNFQYAYIININRKNICITYFNWII